MNEIRKDMRYDGFMNVLSGLNTPGLDRSTATYQSSYARVRSTYDLTNLYISNGLAQKIVDRPADDAFQRGLEIEGDEDDLILAEYDRLSVLTKMAEAIKWMRLYGAAVILVLAKDGGELTDPLNLDTLDTVEDLRVYDLNCIRGTDRYYLDDTDPTTFGKVEYYELIPYNAPAILVHESRLIPVGGDPLPTGLVWYNRVYWAGRSNLEACYKDLVRYDQGLEWSLRLLERKQQGIYKMQGLGNMFAQGDDALVAKRINLVDLVRSNLNSIVVDGEDDYNILTAGMDGIQAMIVEYQNALSASSSLPVTILFGKSTTGLNNTGSGDLEAYYGMVGHIQSVNAKPALEKLTSILWVQKSLKGKAPEDWKIEFNPLWIPTDLEKAQTEQAESQATANTVNALVTLMNNEILAPEEIRKIIVNKFSDFDFSEELPVFPETDLSYAEGVDTTLMDVPGKQPRAIANRGAAPGVTET